jgi:hypothetical protein
MTRKMSVKFLVYDKAAVAKPGDAVERLLKTGEDSCHSLAVTDIFDLEAGDEPRFEQAMAAIDRDFDQVLAKLSASLGRPAFKGTDKDKKFPGWAGTGYRVAFWKKAGRIVYLHVTHVGTVAPVELNLGIVKGPPKNWAAGA